MGQTRLQLIMISNCSSNIENLITQLLIDSRYKQALEIAHKQYQIRQFKIDTLAPNQIFAMYYSLSTRFYYSKTLDNQQSWHENELRIFIWVLVCYSYIQKRCVSKMTTQDWLFFSRIFNERNPEIFEFQGLSILKKESRFIKWEQQETNLLSSIINSKQIKNKWNEIAKQLFLRSDKKYFRTAKQCRQHWINHLDPKPKRSNWHAHEDYQLVETVQKMGKKWAKVSKMLQVARTEHMVKNRFKSLYQQQTKLYKTEQLKNLKEESIIEDLLTKLYQASLQIKSQIANFDQVKKQGNDIENEGNISSAEEVPQVINTIQPEEEIKIQGLQFKEENSFDAEEDQLFKFTLNIQTINSFRSLYDNENQLSRKKGAEVVGNIGGFFVQEFQ